MVVYSIGKSQAGLLASIYAMGAATCGSEIRAVFAEKVAGLRDRHWFRITAVSAGHCDCGAVAMRPTRRRTNDCHFCVSSRYGGKGLVKSTVGITNREVQYNPLPKDG